MTHPPPLNPKPLCRLLVKIAPCYFYSHYVPMCWTPPNTLKAVPYSTHTETLDRQKAACESMGIESCSSTLSGIIHYKTVDFFLPLLKYNHSSWNWQILCHNLLSHEAVRWFGMVFSTSQLQKWSTGGEGHWEIRAGVSLEDTLFYSPQWCSHSYLSWATSFLNFLSGLVKFIMEKPKMCWKWRE